MRESLATFKVVIPSYGTLTPAEHLQCEAAKRRLDVWPIRVLFADVASLAATVFACACRSPHALLLLTLQDVATRLSVATSTVKAIPRRDLPYVKVGHGVRRTRRRYRPEDVASYLALEAERIRVVPDARIPMAPAVRKRPRAAPVSASAVAITEAWRRLRDE